MALSLIVIIAYAVSFFVPIFRFSFFSKAQNLGVQLSAEYSCIEVLYPLRR